VLKYVGVVCFLLCGGWVGGGGGGGATTASLVVAANRKLPVAAGNKRLNACVRTPAAVYVRSLLFWDNTQR
jgi:hypothetical protein